MRKNIPILIAASMAAVFGATFLSAEEPVVANGAWRAELGGPAKRCNVPQRILFISGDAIISGEITFRNNKYYPRGRLEDTFEADLALVRRHGDPNPLVSIKAKVDEIWNGKWAAAGKDCAGPVRIVPRWAHLWKCV
jgi:hypothetical protein